MIAKNINTNTPTMVTFLSTKPPNKAATTDAVATLSATLAKPSRCSLLNTGNLMRSAYTSAYAKSKGQLFAWLRFVVGNAVLPAKNTKRHTQKPPNPVKDWMVWVRFDRLCVVRMSKKMLPKAPAFGVHAGYNNLTKAATALTAITINVPNLIVMRCSS